MPPRPAGARRRAPRQAPARERVHSQEGSPRGRPRGRLVPRRLLDRGPFATAAGRAVGRRRAASVRWRAAWRRAASLRRRAWVRRRALGPVSARLGPRSVRSMVAVVLVDGAADRPTAAVVASVARRSRCRRAGRRPRCRVSGGMRPAGGGRRALDRSRSACRTRRHDLGRLRADRVRMTALVKCARARSRGTRRRVRCPVRPGHVRPVPWVHRRRRLRIHASRLGRRPGGVRREDASVGRSRVGSWAAPALPVGRVLDHDPECGELVA
jgi:hypothetical protein